MTELEEIESWSELHDVQYSLAKTPIIKHVCLCVRDLFGFARCSSPHMKYKTALIGRQMTGRPCFFPIRFCPP